MSLETANSVYEWAWRISVFGAGVTLLGVGLLWVSTRVRDHDFEERMSAANTASAAANVRAAGLEAEAASAKLELARIQQAIGARIVTREQHAKLVANLTRIRGTLHGTLHVAVANGQEPDAYATALLAAFTEAGIPFTVNRHVISMPPTVGVHVVDAAADRRLAHAMAEATIDVISFHKESEPLSLFVGVKPLQQ